MPFWWNDEKQRRRNVAFIANFVLPGLGYAYLGRRGIFEKLLIAGYLIGYFIWFAWGPRTPTLSSYGAYYLTLYYLGDAGGALIAIAFAYDARSMAEAQDKVTPPSTAVHS